MKNFLLGSLKFAFGMIIFRIIVAIFKKAIPASISFFAFLWAMGYDLNKIWSWPENALEWVKNKFSFAFVYIDEFTLKFEKTIPFIPVEVFYALVIILPILYFLMGPSESEEDNEIVTLDRYGPRVAQSESVPAAPARKSLTAKDLGLDKMVDDLLS